LALTSTALGQRKSLEVGDAAPGLQIDTWVKGDETAIETGKVYVVEFWATWCPPCRKSIPHLTKLQQEYGEKGLTIIGISNEKTDKVKPFVQQQGDKMDYTVAVDRRDATNRAWMKAANKKGIPTAFIVDQKGKIAFIGHPMDEQMDAIIAQCVGGRYDPILQKQAAPVIRAARNARKVKNWRMATRHYNEVVALDAAVFADIALEQFEMMLVDMDDVDGAYAYAAVLADTQFVDDPEAQQMLADQIATDPTIPPTKRDLDMALELAEAALQAQGRSNPQALAAVARIHYARQEIDQAIEYQKRAYFQASTKNKPDFKRVLQTYQRAQSRVQVQ
jgi:thiol-disulfide isomerase/thioredoxin